jgi:hypothetical protein
MMFFGPAQSLVLLRFCDQSSQLQGFLQRRIRDEAMIDEIMPSARENVLVFFV